MIVLNLVIGVIMNSMDESNAEMSIKQEMERRNKNPEPIRDGLHDLQKSLEELSEEMKVIKKMIEEKAKQLSKTFSYIDKPMHMSSEALLLPKLDKFSILNLYKNMAEEEFIYDFSTIEKRWQEYWEREKIFRAEDDSEKPKYYALDMFPYPSGAGLHIGHPEGYVASDILARYKKACGFNDFIPWDGMHLVYPPNNMQLRLVLIHR